MPLSRRRAMSVAMVVAWASGLAGCASSVGTGVGGLTPARIGYVTATGIYPYGHSTTELAPDRYRIEVGGYPTTPKSHLEKIATVRAAEIGVESRLGFFKIESMTHSEQCTPAKQATNKVMGHGELRRSVLQAEVSYSKTQDDPAFQPAKQTFETLRPQLDSDPVTPELPATSTPASCS